MDVYKQYKNAVENNLKNIYENNLEEIEKAAQLFAKSINNNGLVHMYGSGHSRMAVEEVFPRYGSFPGFHPIVELSTSFHNNVVGANGQRQAMFIENVEGLGEKILDNFIFNKNDCFFLVSNSGTNVVVTEMALKAKEMNLPVVALTSTVNAKVSAPKHSSGEKLSTLADIILDTHVPIGDAVVRVDNLKYPVSPISTLANSFIINLFKARVAELLTQAGNPPLVLTGPYEIGSEASEQLFEDAYNDYRKRVWRGDPDSE